MIDAHCIHGILRQKNNTDLKLKYFATAIEWNSEDVIVDDL